MNNSHKAIDPIICLKNIGKFYHSAGQQISALTNINLNIYEGDYLSVSGPSGCGKSTLLSIMGLLETPSEGEYRIAGHDTSSLDANQLATLRNRHIGFLFQSFNLIDELNVEENVAMPLTYRTPAYSSKEIKSKVNAALIKVSMADFSHRRPNELSGGQQQRVAIARALVAEPTILLVDEPTGNLDSVNGDAIMRLLSDLNGIGTTICIVTHDQRYENLAKIRCVLFDGQMNQEYRQSGLAEGVA